MSNIYVNIDFYQRDPRSVFLTHICYISFTKGIKAVSIDLAKVEAANSPRKFKYPDPNFESIAE